MTEPRLVSLSEQLDPSTPAYVNARLMELEQKFQQAPALLRDARNKVAVAVEAHQLAKAHAHIKSESANQQGREADALIHTQQEREAVRVAEAAYQYLKDKVHEFSRELDSLRTRSTNLRAEINISGKGT